MGTKIIKSKKGKKGWLIGAIVCIILSIGMFILEKTGGDAEKGAYIVYLSLGLVCSVVYLMTYEHAFYLATNDNSHALLFLIDKPSKEELDTFITTLKKERKDYLLSKYAQLTKLITYEQQYNTLGWLNRVDVLSKEEYNAKVEDLNSLFSCSNSIIGFHNRSN